MKTNHNNLLIYLKGINSAELEHVTDFLYNGETFITQEELKMFLETAKELQIKGLQGDLQGMGQNESETMNENNEIDDQESILDSLTGFADSFDAQDGTLDRIEENDSALNRDQ